MIYSNKIIDPYSDSSFTAYWKMDLEDLNASILPVFIYMCVFGIMLFSIFDYYSTPDLWFQFFVQRIILCVTGLILLQLVKTDKMELRTGLNTFMALVYVFFAYGASQIETLNSLMAWNTSIAVAGVLWPYVIIIVSFRKVVLLNLFFSITYIIFYLSFSSIALQDYLVYGGLFLLFSVVVAPFLAQSRFTISRQNSWLRYQFEKTNTELIKSNEKLIEMNASKDKFFSIISHDLRSPFNSMLGLSDLLSDQVDDLARSEIVEYARMINTSAQKAFKLLQNLLDWARSQTGRITFQPEDIHLQSIIVDVIDTLADVCKDKQISVKYLFTIDDHIYADKNMIESIIRNLLTNAIKFTKRGGEINITVSGSVDETIVAIRDSGIGIAPEKIDRLFLINERTTTEGTDKEQGTGLGLILCKEFVDKHGGEIRVESTPGVGSIFTFTIPRKAS